MRSLGLQTDLMVRRLAGSEIRESGAWLVVRTPSNPSYYWGNFLVAPSPPEIGTAAEWRAEFTEAFPGARHRAYAVDGTDGAIGDPTEIAALGVRVEVSTVLTASAAQGLAVPPSLPRETACRRLDGDLDWEQLVELRAATYGSADTPQERAFAERKVAESRALVEAGHGGWVGAFRHGRLVSALGVVGEGTGLARYQNVETHPEHRRLGLARRLLYEAGAYAMGELAAQTLVIVADPEYHAIDLYRSVGFIDREQQVQYELAE